MCRIVIKSGIHLKLRVHRLHHLDQLSCVIHPADSVLDPDQIIVCLPQLQDHLRSNGISRPIREIVDINRSVNLSKQLVIECEQRRTVKSKIIRRYDHRSIGSLLQAPVGIGDNLLLQHRCRSDDALHAMVDVFNGKLCQLLARLHAHREELANAAADQDAVNAVLNQVIKKLPLAFQIQRTVFLQDRHCRCDIVCIHFAALSLCCLLRRTPFAVSLVRMRRSLSKPFRCNAYSSPPPSMALRAFCVYIR